MSVAYLSPKTTFPTHALARRNHVGLNTCWRVRAPNTIHNLALKNHFGTLIGTGLGAGCSGLQRTETARAAASAWTSPRRV